MRFAAAIQRRSWSEQKTDGVKTADVDLDKGSAAVTYDEAKIKPDQIVKVIKKERCKAEPQNQKKWLN